MTQELNQELTKANLTQAIIAGLQGQAEVLLAEKITSKADYEAVDRFRKDVKNYRLAGEKIFEHEIAERNRLHKEAIAKKKDVLAPIIDVENKAKARVFEWEYEQEQKAKKAEEDRLRAIEERKTALMEMGYMLKEGVWTLEAMSVDAEEVLKASYEKWTNLFRSLRMHGEEVAAAKAEAIRLQEEEAARLLKDRQELEAREAALKEAEAKMRASVNEAMKNELLATDQRVAMDGDKELVRQCLLVVQNAGTKLKEIVPRVNTAALKDKVEQTMEMLRNCYVELNKLQQ
jgi:hypothetical protein